MRRRNLFGLLACVALTLTACAAPASAVNREGQVASAAPKGMSTATWTPDNGDGTFTNPLFYDEFSDPDLIRVGDWFYLTGTTMHAMPGLPIPHSRDLVNWRWVAYAFDRLDLGPDFRLEGGKEIYGQGIWAPSFRYHNGIYYIFAVELNPDLTALVPETDRVLITSELGMGEGSHFYKINGHYYIVSAIPGAHVPMKCARADRIDGPWEVKTISEGESLGIGQSYLGSSPIPATSSP